MKLFAGLDVSTQSCKLVVVDYDKREVVYQTAVNYDQDLPHYRTRNGVCQGLEPGVSESEPGMWLEALDLVFSRLLSSPVDQNHILAISVSGQQHGLVALDREGNLTRPRSKLWNDFSTLPECRHLTEQTGGTERMIAEIGNIQRTGYTAGKILHFRNHEPESYRRSSTLFLVHNYINWYLTGAGRTGIRVMEPGDTSGMALWHPQKKAWSDKLIGIIDPGLRQKLPPVYPADQMIGRIGAEFADKYALSRACQVDAGSGDNMYGAVGTGNVAPGVVSVSLGTSGTAFTILEEPFIDPLGEIACYCDSTGLYMALVCVSNLANGYNELLRLFNWNHEKFSAVYRKTPPANGGRMIIPWFCGERTPDIPEASPLYFGYGLQDFNREHLCRGVLEGSVLNLHEGFQRLNIQPREIRLTGGLSRSEDWCQAISDIFEAETVPVTGEGAALGAALHGAWVWHGQESPLTIQETVDPFIQLDDSRRKIPRLKHRAAYRKQKELFHALSKRIQGQSGADPFKLRQEMLTTAAGAAVKDKIKSSKIQEVKA